MTVIPGPRRAWADARTGPAEILAGVILLVLVALGAVSGSLSILGMLAAGALALLAVVGDARWLLFAYVALIPFDGSGELGGIGTLSRVAGIGFALVHLLHRRSSLRVDTIGVAGWAFVGVATASYLWSIDRTATLPQLITLVQLVLVALLVADLIVERPATARPIALVYAASATLTGVIGTLAWVTNASALPAGRAVAFDAQDPAQFSAILIPAVFVLTWEMLRRPNLLVAAGVAVCSIALLASGTRSAWVAVTVVMAVGLVPRMTRRQQLALVVAVAAILAMAVAVPTLNELTLGRLAAVIESGGTGRTDIWTIGLSQWTQQPVLGVGYGAFPSALTLEVVRATDLPTADTGFLVPPIGSHSILVGTLVELGVIGTACLAAFLWSVVRPRAGGEVERMARLAVLAMVAQAFFLDIVGRKQVWLFIALATGLAAGRATRALRPGIAGVEAALPGARAPTAVEPVAPAQVGPGAPAPVDADSVGPAQVSADSLGPVSVDADSVGPAIEPEVPTSVETDALGPEVPAAGGVEAPVEDSATPPPARASRRRRPPAPPVEP